ncbi:hypothetical protein [Micromonospora sp. NBC_01813]|uniref:hypothetical protein n=1 Tax=Micromonospora sp. NBC_01813 TaxID=2975988 RepID=UPI002DDA0B73|nr:hypothetical protein [Micromonospora sp. NBC_01813]WSA06695.1 hypothetical protein OG958_20660 [Micromonospora sp. NBC_01813]
MTTYRHVRRTGRRTAPLAAALAVAAFGLLAACGGGGEDSTAGGGTATGAQGSAGDGGVASIVGTPGPDTSPSPQAERPLIRPDTSPEEEERLYAVYQQCLEDNGLPKGLRVPQDSGDSELAPGAPETDEELAAARKAGEICASVEPEATWERAMRLDPTYRDKLQVWVKCLQDKGVDAYADGDSLMLNDGLPAGNEIRECEAEAFTAG